MPVARMGFRGKLDRELCERASVCPVWANLRPATWANHSGSRGPSDQLLREGLLVVIAPESPLS